MGDTIQFDFARLAAHANRLDTTTAELRDLARRLVRLSSGLATSGADAQPRVAEAASALDHVVQVLDYERKRVAGYGTGLVVAERPFLTLPPWQRRALLAEATARYLRDRLGDVVSTTQLSGTVDLSVGVGIASLDGQVSVSYTEVLYEDGSRLVTITDGAGIGGSVGTPGVGAPGTPSAELSAMLHGRAGRSYVVPAGEGVTDVLLREALLHQAAMTPQLAPAIRAVVGRLPEPDLDTTEVEVTAGVEADLVYSAKAGAVSFPLVRTEDHRAHTVTTERGWLTTGSVLYGSGARAGVEGTVGVRVAVTKDRHGEITTIAVTEVREVAGQVVDGVKGPVRGQVATSATKTTTTERVIHVDRRPDLRAELTPLVDGLDWELAEVAAVLRRHAGARTTTEHGTSVSVSAGADLEAVSVDVTVDGERTSVASERLEPPGPRR